MKVKYFAILLIFLFLISCSNKDNQKVSSLKINSAICEYLLNPLGIDVLQPRLSWKLSSYEKNKSQSAYRILVASGLDLLNKNKGDLWDTGKKKSDQSIQVTYEGRSLRSRQKCFWKVMVWDEKDAQSKWSNVSTWEMALLDKADWRASWIEAPRIYDWTTEMAVIANNQKTDPKKDFESAPYLRKSFNTSKTIKRARAYISGVGYYEFYINGAKVGDHVLDPTFTNYDKRVHYLTYDVSELLIKGKNTLGILLGDGWYNMHSRAVWGFSQAPWRDRPTCLLQLEIEYEDGTAETVISDESWKAAPSPIIYNDIREGEKYDARLEITDWNKALLDDSSWANVRLKSGPKGFLKAQMIPANKIMREVRPVSVKSPKPGIYIVDMGQNMAGWISLKVRGFSGQVVKMKFGELLNADGTLNQLNINRHHREPDFQVGEYILKGKGEEIWEPKFTYYGFQYIELSGYPGILTIDDIVGKVVHTSFEKSGSFSCSNEIINKILKAADWSYISNFLGYPTDCPQREKNGWTGDAHLAAETGLLTYKPQMAYTKWLFDCRDAQLENGLLPGIVPTSGWGYNLGDWVKDGFGPAWDGAYIWLPWYLYIYSGDKHILAEHYRTMKKSVDYMTGKAKNHILDIGLGDWVFIKTYAPRDLTSTACYYDLTNKFAQIAALLNNQQDAAFYAQLAENIKTAFNQKFYKSGEKTYANSEQTSLAAALYFKLVPEADVQTVAATLSNVIIKNDTLLDCGVLGAKWIPHALSDNGYADIAYAIAKNMRYPGWGNWIEKGATTLWEDFNTESNDNSHNHMFFGDIVHWCYKVLAGIIPDENNPGFKHFFIEPYFAGSLDFVSASHESMYGKIVCEWKKTPTEIALKIEIPVNTSSTVKLPKGEILINNVQVSGSDIAKEYKEENGFISFCLGSGKHNIILKR
jgi:alpha-L-rhamnosidase